MFCVSRAHMCRGVVCKLFGSRAGYLRVVFEAAERIKSCNRVYDDVV